MVRRFRKPLLLILQILSSCLKIRFRVKLIFQLSPLGNGENKSAAVQSLEGMGCCGGTFLAKAVGAVADAEDLDFHFCEALIDEAEFAGDRLGDIKQATRDEWAPVIQADCGGAAVFEIGDTDFAGEGECFVGGGAGPWPDILAGGCFAGKNEPAFVVVGSDADIHVPQAFAGLHGVVADASDRVGFCFIAFHTGAHAACQGHQTEGEGGLQRSKEDFFHDAVRGFSKSSAALREAGMRPQ